MSDASVENPMRPRRSCLFVPAGNERALDKARTLAADVTIFDLEDATAPDAKDAARQRLETGMRDNRPRGETVVRVNDLSTPWGHDDLAAIATLAPDAVLLPKVSGADDIRAVTAALDAAGAPASIRLWAMIETPRGVIEAADIAATALDEGARLACLVAGTNDLMKETRLPATPGRPHLAPWLMQIVLAARGFSLDVIDGVYNDFADSDGFRRECETGSAMGFDGKSLIHPTQIDIANAVFGIDENTLAEARKVVAAFDAGAARGEGVVNVDGRMVERLHRDAARRLVERADLEKQQGNA